MDELDELVQQGKDHVETVTEGTLISIILDKSGSMKSVMQDTIDGFNKLIEDQKKEPGKAWVSLTLFDTAVHVEYVALPIDQVPQLTSKTYNPSGGTALLDAQGITIEATEKYLAGLADTERPENILIVTMTDGGENSSQDYTTEKLKALIDAKQEADDWDFAYTGANQDSFAVASTMGYSKNMTMDYAAGAAGSTLNTLSSSMSAYRSMSPSSRRKRYAGGQSFWDAKKDEKKDGK